MSKFRAKNGQGARNLFGERINYKVNAFPYGPDNQLLPPIKDFSFAEMRLYGRINKNHDVIIINPVRLAKIPTSVDNLRAANFVVDAFEDMVRDFQKASFANKISSDDPYLSDLRATRGFIDPNSQYAVYVGNLVKYFTNHYLTPKSRRRIVNFSSFIPVFIRFLEETSAIRPITKTAFIASTFCDASISGLAIYVGGYNAGDDRVKEEFINSPNFSFFKSVALNRGFSIDQNTPWRLVANISSPPMLRYASRYGAPTEDAVLSRFYERGYGEDIINLKKLALECYNAFVALHPRNFDAGGVCMQPISLQDFVKEYPSLFWVDPYINVRYNEQKKPTSMAAKGIVGKQARDIYAASGIYGIIQHVNEVFRGFANFQGSFATQYLKQKNAKTGKHFKPSY